ncbi:MAG UNVERIFIED_CONTAM: ATP-binding protein [Planctomycetaceae bacterium]|jgi:predicted AAA+ superfamily ATPase
MNIPRTAYFQTLQQRLLENPIVSLVGPRQTGKSTLARMVAKASAQTVHFFDLESPSDLARLVQPELVLRPLQGLVILDEVQRRPDLFPLLRVLADRPDSPARFLILGSASPEFMKASSESLAGRVSFIEVTGFSLAELGAEALSRLWWRGGFPRAFLASSDRATRQWLEDFRRTFLERDIPQLGIRVPAVTLGRFWTMVAHYHGQVLNFAELARSLGSSEPTARRYLDILSGTCVVRQLPPWFQNLGKRQLRSPKVYIRDAGLLHTLLGIANPAGLQSHPKLGASWKDSASNRSSASVVIATHTSGARTVVPSWTCCCLTKDADSVSSSSSRTVRRQQNPCESSCRIWHWTISMSCTQANILLHWTPQSPRSHCLRLLEIL